MHRTVRNLLELIASHGFARAAAMFGLKTAEYKKMYYELSKIAPDKIDLFTSKQKLTFLYLAYCKNDKKTLLFNEEKDLFDDLDSNNQNENEKKKTY